MKKYLIYLFALTLSACTQETKKSEENTAAAQQENEVILTDAQVKTAGIQTGMIEEKSLSNIIKVNGHIDVPPQNMGSISAPMGGYVKSCSLLPGMAVKKGQVIVVLEEQEFIALQQDYLNTKARLEVTEAEYKRQQELNANKASSDKLFQQAKVEYTATRISLKALAEKLEMLNINPAKLNEKTLSRDMKIYAPFNGFVSKVNINNGKYVMPSDILLELVNPNDIHLNLKIYEKDIALLKPGMQVLAYTNIDQAKKYNCEIVLISKSISVDGSTEVHCYFEQYDAPLLPGMYMNAEIEVAAVKSQVVPEDAVVNFEGRDYIFLALAGNRFRMTEVKAGQSGQGFVALEDIGQIKNGRIVTKGAYALLMSLKNASEEE